MKLLCYLKEDEYNTSNYIYPVFSIEDDYELVKLSKDETIDLFPHKGTFYMPSQFHKIKQYVNKLFFVELDEDDVTIQSENFDPDIEDNRAKYRLSSSDLIYPKSDELIEVIEFDYSKNHETGDFMDIAEYDRRREIYVKEMPLNKHVMLHMEEKLYGPFLFEDVSEENNHKIRLIAKETENYKISMYSYFDLENVILASKYSYRSTQLKHFIYNLAVLDDFNCLEKIDFVEDKVLLNEFSKVFNSTTQENNLTKSQQAYMKSLLEDGNVLPFNQERKDRLLRIDGIIALFNEKKMEITNDFINSDEGKDFIKKNILDDVSLLDNIPEYNYVSEKVNKKITDLEEKLIIRQREYDEVVTKTNEIKEKEKIDFTNSVIDKQKEYDELVEKVKKEKETLDKIDKLNKFESEVVYLERTIEVNKEKLKEIEKKIEEKLNTGIEELLVEDVLNDTIIDKYRKKKMLKDMEIEYIRPSSNSNFSADELIEQVYVHFEKSGRMLEKTEIINYLITISQNFMTVFAGPPGTGKTSFCRILAKSLGVYNDRFLKIPVKRGWTSSNDLVGYYNPISQTIEKSNTGLFDALSIVDYESKENIPLPYFVLLDEANLSPLEHYWSDFISISDSSSNREVYFTDELSFKVNDGFKFLSTINYDHTTEILSPRFLDRVAVVRMENSNHYDFNILDCEDDVCCEENIISQEKLTELFSPNLDDLREGLDNYMGSRFTEILKVCRNDQITFIPVSPRTLKAILSYYSVGKKYYHENKNLSLDFAIAQFLLPQINGDGESYRNLLVNLEKTLESANMIKSKEIVNQIIRKGRKDYDNYKFF